MCMLNLSMYDEEDGGQVSAVAIECASSMLHGIQYGVVCSENSAVSCAKDKTLPIPAGCGTVNMRDDR
jgi:hypothetical protein